MGSYINTGNYNFQSARNSEYVDKSGLISVVNATLNTEQRFSCVTRSRRFGKSMAAKMLCAYYDQSCDSRSLFADLQIASAPSFETHLNKYPVIYLDMSDFVTRFHKDNIVEIIDRKLKKDILQAYSMQQADEDDDLMDCLISIADSTKQQFIFIIDEWDAICREFDNNGPVMDDYVNWLRRLFKSGQTARVFAGVYMTGILPVKKYNTQSALNNFVEYSMVEPMDMPQFFGFTKDEVRALATKHGMDYDDLEKWYDGYQIGSQPNMFNPNSVMMALKARFCRSYWSSTGAFDAVAGYIKMNYEGLKDNMIDLLAGGRIKVNTTKFENDMSAVRNRDDVLTVLIHLGYLTFDRTRNECYVPNYEVAGEMRNAVEETDWNIVINAMQRSERLLQDTLLCNGENVAAAIDSVHDEQTSILSYNDENSLACVVSIAYYAARNDYVIHREMASGRGFADIVFLPRKHVDKPALVIELKCGKSADEAIKQIKDRKYMEKVRQHTSDILLVGINYDRDSKTHTCVIEQETKD